ncbi:hypothetical protein IW261DRAFT_1454139 [Armillaria novae-zelandiae]|uniref:Uncharacterized protein n=1 Tax=Armillaria novae-zelandiae TaxID=153914 RepID=A0AA39PLB9_9AGAR|nr:hypothetical protein IW261DRAFT_1454139 [Armillaria novae-zelandiae]
MLLLLSFQVAVFLSQCSAEGVEVPDTLTRPSSSIATATPTTSLPSDSRRRKFLVISMFCAAAVLIQVVAIILYLLCRARKLNMENDMQNYGKNLDEGKCVKG